MEKEVCDKSLNDYIRKITTPIFDKVLSESNDNPMMVGRVQESNQIQFLWQPHNYRLYFNFNKKNFNPPLYKYPSKKVGFKYSLKNYNSEHHFDNFHNCRIIIKKKLAEVINKSHEKQWRLITANNINEIDKRINEVIKKLNKQGIYALKQLIKRFGGNSDLKIIKIRGEHGIHGVDYIDKIPEDMIIHDTVFKKPYKRKLEFYDPVYVKNTVTNKAVNDIAPEISNSINNLGNNLIPTIRSLDKSIKLEIENKKIHRKVLNSMDKTLKEIRDSLPKRGLLKWL